MSAPSPSRPSSPGLLAVLLLALVLAGLALYFWAVPRTPVVAHPAAAERAP
jgi:hypothetical protein